MSQYLSSYSIHRFTLFYEPFCYVCKNIKKPREKCPNCFSWDVAAAWLSW